MTNRLFIDADVILGLVLNRGGGIYNDDTFWHLLESKQIQAYVADMGLDKIREHMGRLQDFVIADKLQQTIQSLVHIHTVTPKIAQCARCLPIQDYDSAVEVACAMDLRLTAIVTQQPHNFHETSLRLMSLDDVIRQHLIRTVNLSPVSPLRFRGSGSVTVESELLQLGYGQSVHLFIKRSLPTDGEIDVEAILRVANNQSFLPAGINLTLCDQLGDIVLVAPSYGQERAIVLPFSGKPGEVFSVQIAWQSTEETRTFTV